MFEELGLSCSTRKKGRPKPPKGPPPTQPTYYETQISAALSAADLLQSNQNCNYETTLPGIPFNLTAIILPTTSKPPPSP